MPLSPADISQITTLVAAQLAAARIKISELPAAGSLSREAVFPAVDSGATVKATLALLLAQGVSVVPVGQSLRAMDVATVADGAAFITLGVDAVNDGGGGLWVYDANSVATDNIGTVIAPDSGVGRFLRDFSGDMDARWFEAGMGGNDTVPLQLALSAAIDAETNLFLPDADYTITSPLNINGAIRVHGSGYNTFLSFTTSTVGFNISADNVTMEKMRIGGATSRMIHAGKVSGTGLLLRDLDISGATVAPLTLNIAGIYADGYSNVLVDHCYVHGCGQASTPRGHSICFNNGTLVVSTNVIVNNCRIETTQATLGVTFFNCTESAALVNEVSGSTIDDVTSSGYGITFYKTGGASANTNNNRVLGNFIYNTQGIGIYFTDNDGSVANSNIIRNTCQSQTEATLTVGGIGLNICTSMMVDGNTIVTSGKNGICMVGTNNTITNNNISAVGNYGIRFLTTASGHIISGNRITTSSLVGIGSSTVTLTDCVIAGNLMTGCTYAAMFFANLTECSVTGNSTKTSDYGFQIQAGANNVISNNFFKTLTNKAIEYSGTTSLIVGNRIDSGAVAGIDISAAPAANGNRVRDNLITNTVNPILTANLAIVQTITAGNPSKLLCDVAFLAYAGATNVTAIAGGNFGDEITLYASNGTSTIKHSASLILNGAVDFAMAGSNTLTLRALDNSTWVEIGRKV